MNFNINKEENYLSNFELLKTMIGNYVHIQYEQRDANAAHKSPPDVDFKGLLIEVFLPSWYKQDPIFEHEVPGIHINFLNSDGTKTKFYIDGYYTDDISINALE